MLVCNFLAACPGSSGVWHAPFPQKHISVCLLVQFFCICYCEFECCNNECLYLLMCLCLCHTSVVSCLGRASLWLGFGTVNNEARLLLRWSHLAVRNVSLCGSDIYPCRFLNRHLWLSWCTALISASNTLTLTMVWPSSAHIISYLRPALYQGMTSHLYRLLCYINLNK